MRPNQASQIPGSEMWNTRPKPLVPQTDAQNSSYVPIINRVIPRENDPDQPGPQQHQQYFGDSVGGAKALLPLLQAPKNIPPLEDFRNRNRLILRTNLDDYFNQLEPAAHLGRASANYLPLQHAKYLQNQKKKASLENYLSMLEKTTRDQSNTTWKTMGAKWDEFQKVWKLPNNTAFNKKLDVDSKRKKIKSLGEYNDKLLTQQLTDKQIAENIPNLVKQLILSNEQLSRYGFGKVSAKSLPFYGGRYLDPFTGRIKTVGMMSQKYLNPTNYRQHLLYLQSKVVGKWNNFVRAEQQYTKFTKLTPMQYTNNQVESINKALKKQDNIKTAFNGLWKQIQLWRASLPVPQNVEIVCQQMLAYLKENVNQFFALIEKIAKTKKGQEKATEEFRQKYIAQLEKGYKALQQPKEGATVNEVNKYAKATAAFGLWINKGIAMTQRALKKYVRTFIPSQIEPQKIQLVADQLKNADEKINSVFGKLSVDGEGKYIGLGKLQQAKSVQQFIQSVTDFKPQGTKARVIPLFMREKKKIAGKVYPEALKLKY